MITSTLAPLGGGDRMLRMSDLVRLLGVTRPTISVLIERGAFPQGVRIGTRVRVWPETQVRDWIAAREAEALNG